MVKIILITLLALVSCRNIEERKTVEFQLLYDTQDHLWKIDNNQWINNENPTSNFQCTSTEICVKSLSDCKYQFNSNTYEFIEVTPLNFQNQPQINISPNNFIIIPNCNYFNDTDILSFKIKAFIQ